MQYINLREKDTRCGRQRANGKCDHVGECGDGNRRTGLLQHQTQSVGNTQLTVGQSIPRVANQKRIINANSTNSEILYLLYNSTN